MIDEKKLIAEIREHAKRVTSDNEFVDAIYKMAHEHIIDIINRLVNEGCCDNG